VPVARLPGRARFRLSPSSLPLPASEILRDPPPSLRIDRGRRLWRWPALGCGGVDTEKPVRTENTGVGSVREIIIVSTMTSFFIALLALVASTFRTRAAAEIVALRHQIAVLQRSSPRRLRLKQPDRLLWILLSCLWPGWRRCAHIVKPDTVIRWHRTAFARYWTWKSRRRAGRPAVAAAIRDLIQRLSRANGLWGAPRIHGELLKLARLDGNRRLSSFDLS